MIPPLFDSRCRCLLCKSIGMTFVNKLRDDDARFVAECVSCGHVQLTPLPTIEEDEMYYQQDEMLKNIYKNEMSLQTEEALMYRMELFVREQADHFCKFLPRQDVKILEIGSGFGWLPQVMREKGYYMDGIEINDEKRELCRLRCGIALHGWNFYYDVPEVVEKHGYYDVLCLMHTLEHISDPRTFLARASLLLKPGGMIYVDVPNYNDWFKVHQEEYKDWSFMRSHVSCFSPKSLTSLIKDCGFNNVHAFGHQAFSIENALHWHRNKEPSLLVHQMHLPEPLEWLNRMYKQKVEDNLTSCFLVVVGNKA